MAYLYETLGAERFQQFCQALLTKDFPTLQCFPVGQPDGGRDASGHRDGDKSSVVIGQIKFKRTDEEENADWMISALVAELPKIEALIAKGATEYIMMTNASGTAHLGVGRIDRVQEWMDAHISVPAVCFWRDELDRRLDGAQAELKLAYPSVLTGGDALTLIVEAVMGPQRERIGRALRAFVADQYRRDEEVKFRQVELENSLLALFVDVPIDATSLVWGKDHKALTREARSAIRGLAEMHPSRGHLAIADDVDHSGALFLAPTAGLLLDEVIQREIPWIVLQGAPGQGKSTLAQYVCQVHRARYLGKESFLADVDESHRAAAFRVPIKVDLRDLAAYLDGRPYQGNKTPDDEGLRSFERFLASLIAIQSGGMAFSADDFTQVATSVPTLLFLDGLDEVADLALRKTLVDKVLQALNRLKEGGADTQVVVTSRPSLFGRAPSFTKAFIRFELAPITDEIIHAYAAKWIAAKRLDSDRADEVNGILAQKLGLTHIRELTRNPMQLTILLSLILSIGYSLPDVRTDLYREYVNLFMTREAEKSDVVREHRGLLLEIVEYLAWLLQAGAEADRSSGSISGDDIRVVIAKYLEEGDHDQDILEDLFGGGLERVYVLVQRVEGLYEFEVQPLREYFAAKYLYSTAPVGNFRAREVKGDRSQRFEAIAANPYWANVTRFYAGFYEAGEIGALSASLREMATSRDAALALTARSVGAALLTDWVFKSKKFIHNEVVDLVFDEVGMTMAAELRLSGFESASLDRQCGQDRLARKIFSDYVLDGDRYLDHRYGMMLRRNGGPSLREDFVSWVQQASGLERSRRFRLAAISNGLDDVGEETLNDLLEGDSPSGHVLSGRVQYLQLYQWHLVAAHLSVRERIVESALDWGGTDSGNLTTALSFSALVSGEPFERMGAPEEFDEVFKVNDDKSEILRNAKSVLTAIYADAREAPPGAPWDAPAAVAARIERVRATFGDRWASFRASVLSAGYVSVGFTPDSPIDVTAADTPLFSRALVARTWRGRTGWWIQRFEATSGLEQLFWLSAMLAWAPSAHIQANLAAASAMIDALSEDDFARLVEVVRSARHVRQYRGGGKRGAVSLSEAPSRRLTRVIFESIGDAQIAALPAAFADDAELARLVRRVALAAEIAKFPGWGAVKGKKLAGWLEQFREARCAGGNMTSGIEKIYDFRSMSETTAKEVVASARKYPSDVLQAASSRLMLRYQPAAVRDVAEKEEWQFE